MAVLFYFTVIYSIVKKYVYKLVSRAVCSFGKAVEIGNRFLLYPYRKGLVAVLALKSLFADYELFVHLRHLINIMS